ELVSIDTGERTADHVARDVAARTHRGDPGGAQRVQHVGQGFARHPVELEVLSHREVDDAARVPFGEVGDRAELRALEDAVGDPDAHHEVWCAAAFAPG